jgi:diguanylate cyclase (GGDEF)-like protein
LTKKTTQVGTAAARSDILAGGVVVAAAILFVSVGGQVIAGVLGGEDGAIDPTHRLLSIALLLNVALILFGWRRYRDLTAEIKERIAAEARAQSLALRDPLTGFFNRRALSEEGATLLAKSARRHKATAMLMIDLDHFKNVNDIHGHVVGDGLLKAVAAEVVALAPPSALSARLGGDEFACLFAFDAGAPDFVEQVARRIVSRLAQPFETDGIVVHVSASCGIARSEADCTDISGLMRRADIAMYAAKRQGRNRHCWFDGSMERELRRRTELEGAMRAGIPRGEFVPFFEKQMDLATGQLLGFEVLARWQHPVHGLIPPDTFIPIAENTGMITDLSMAVMRAAFIEARNWDPALSISVNISPTQLKDPWLAQKLVKLLAETGFAPSRLDVEITETSLFENLPLAQSIVGSLKNQGIRLSLDDFGTGYSSLAHLRALPFDRIKIDKSFVVSVLDNSESAAIVNAIARLGDSLHLPVTAEGIEHPAIEARLLELGCRKGQGFSYGQPTSIAQTRSLLAERNLLPAARVEATASADVRRAA